LAATVGLELDASLFLSARVGGEALSSARAISLSATAVGGGGSMRVGVPPGTVYHQRVQPRIDQALPIWVSIAADGDPESFRDDRGRIGILWSALTLALWPLILLVCCGVPALALACKDAYGNSDTPHAAHASASASSAFAPTQRDESHSSSPTATPKTFSEQIVSISPVRYHDLQSVAPSTPDDSTARPGDSSASTHCVGPESVELGSR
jgi:hypothetical protein